MGAGEEDFRQGYKTFFIVLWGTKTLSAMFMGHKTILLEKILDEVIDQRLKEKLTDTWK